MIPTGSYVTAVTSREVRDLADLGGASRALGERWEQVGGQATESLVGGELRAPSGESFVCRAVLRLDSDDALLSESSRLGLKSPDCLFAGRDRLGRLVLQPGDFKFTLDIATREQIDPAPIRALLAAGGPRFSTALAGLLRRADETGALASPQTVLDALDAGRARLLPGFFLSPDEPVNRLYLRQSARRRGGGLTEADVRLVPIVAPVFFQGLPGSQAVGLLLERDGLPSPAPDFPTMTYYYQLGAAVTGAVTLLQRPLLPQLGPEPVAPGAETLRHYVASRAGMWAIDVARDLAAPAMQRRDRLRLAQRLANPSLRGRPAYEAIEAAGWQIGETAAPLTLTKLQVRRLLDRLETLLGQVVSAALADRLQQGPLATDQAVLDWLREIRPALDERARQELMALLADPPPDLTTDSEA